MLRFILKFLLMAAYIYLLSNVLDAVYVADYKTAIYVTLILGLLNVTVKPILQLLTLPITFLTLGLFLLVINVLMIYLVEKILSPDFTIDGFGWTFLFSILISLFSTFLNSILEKRKNYNKYNN